MNLISIADLGREDVLRLIQSAEAFRARRGQHGQPLAGKSLAMIFEKPSTRTRICLEVAAWELGGHPLYLSAGELQLGRGETIADTARVLSRYVHAITARVWVICRRCLRCSANCAMDFTRSPPVESDSTSTPAVLKDSLSAASRSCAAAW